MDIEYLKKVIQLFEKSAVSRLTIKGKHDMEITLEKQMDVKEATKGSATVKKVLPAAHYPDATPAWQAPQSVQELDDDKCIKSPMVGTFYQSPSPGEPVYVQQKDDVKKGQVLCIIEAMKVMNEITSEHTGKIKEICVQDGEPVEYGQVLFILE